MTLIRIATYNVLMGHRATGPGSWSERRPLLRQAIASARADVLGLQEVLPSRLADVTELVAPLALVPGPCTGPPRWLDVSFAADLLARTVRTRRLPRAHELRARSERMEAGELLPIAYRADRFERIESGGFWISDRPERAGSLLALAPSPFLVHWTLLAPRDGATPLLVLNAHFGHAPWHHAPTARVVRSQLDSLQAARTLDGAVTPSVFLVGDFNAVPSSALLRSLTSPTGAGFVNAARSAAERTGPPVTYHWGRGATRLGLTLDHVLARTPLRALRAEVIDVHEGRRYPSDHHLLALEFAPPAS